MKERLLEKDAKEKSNPVPVFHIMKEKQSTTTLPKAPPPMKAGAPHLSQQMNLYV